MLKRVVLVLGFLSTFSTVFAQHETEVKAPISEQEQIKIDNKNFIDHHLLDAHSFDIMVKKNEDGTENHIGFPLPVIFYDKTNGFHTMMSSEFHHGENVVESKGGHYKLFHEKIYKTDASGAINLDEHHHATNEKVIDFSLTKGVLMILVTSLLMLWIFGSMARNYKKSLVPSGVG